MRLVVVSALAVVSLFGAPAVYAQQCVPKGPRVALTFDDGPTRGSTEGVLRTLSAHGVPGTFFMVGGQLRSSPALARKVHAAGHEIGLHSDRHARLDRMSPSAAASDMRANLTALRAAVPGASVRFWRAPYGNVPGPSGVAAIRSVLPRGVSHAGWTYDTLDWFNGRTRDSFLRSSGGRLGARNIILMHDHTRPTQLWLGDLIQSMRARGAVFVRMSELGLPSCKVVRGQDAPDPALLDHEVSNVPPPVPKEP